jgi:hypothetical protein
MRLLDVVSSFFPQQLLEKRGGQQREEVGEGLTIMRVVKQF